MTDLYVHQRMKECCRNTLKELDKRKRKAKFRSGILAIPSLHAAFADKPIDEALGTLATVGIGIQSSHEGELEHVTKATCGKICQKHAELHERKGEATEARFWSEIAIVC